MVQKLASQLKGQLLLSCPTDDKVNSGISGVVTDVVKITPVKERRASWYREGERDARSARIGLN